MKKSCVISKEMMQFLKILIKVDRRDIYYVRFIFEGYDGLGIVSTEDAVQGRLIITYPAGSRYDILDLVNALQEEGVVKEVTEA